MIVLATLFLFGCFLRLVCVRWDDGFGGRVWNAICAISTATWIIGAIMGIHVLTGISLHT